MRKAASKNSSRIVFLFLVPVFTLFGCSASKYRQNADEVAADPFDTQDVAGVIIA